MVLKEQHIEIQSLKTQHLVAILPSGLLKLLLVEKLVSLPLLQWISTSMTVEIWSSVASLFTPKTQLCHT